MENQLTFANLAVGDTVFIRRKISATEPDIEKYHYMRAKLVVRHNQGKLVGYEVLDSYDDGYAKTHHESSLRDETVFVFENPFNYECMEPSSDKSFLLVVLADNSAKYRTVVEACCSDGQKYILDVSDTKFKSDIMGKCKELRWKSERAQEKRAKIFKQYKLEYDDPYDKEHSRLED